MILGVPIFLTIIAFVSVILIHELGHYLVGRWFGIGASVFSIGFGPKLFSYTDRNNTEWMISLIPLGGFVKFITNKDNSLSNIPLEENLNIKAVQSNTSFESAGLIARVLTVLAGPFANFLMSVLIFSCVTIITGTVSTEPIIGKVEKLPGNINSLLPGDKILAVQDKPVENFNQVYDIAVKLGKRADVNFRILRNQKVLNLSVPYIFQPIVFHVEMFSPAMKSGIKVGDIFLEADQQSVASFEDIKVIINASKGNQVLIKLWRNGEIIVTSITPELRPTETLSGNLTEEMRIGVRGGPLLSPQMTTPNLLEAGHMGIRMTFYVVKTSLIGLARMIDNTISPKNLSGPIGVAKALSHSVSEGFIPFLSLLATISAGIGLINLFPIPVLDGGHLMMFLYEGIFKAPPPESIVKSLMVIGISILLGLMVFATFNDIVR